MAYKPVDNVRINSIDSEDTPVKQEPESVEMQQWRSQWVASITREEAQLNPLLQPWQTKVVKISDLAHGIVDKLQLGRKTRVFQDRPEERYRI